MTTNFNMVIKITLSKRVRTSVAVKRPISCVNLFVKLLVSMCLKVPTIQEMFVNIVAGVLFSSVYILYIYLEVCQEGKYISAKRAGKGFLF